VAIGADGDELSFTSEARTLLRKAVLLKVRASPLLTVGLEIQRTAFGLSSRESPRSKSRRALRGQ
jgi:hypothetical protein